jgi:hypothetical protein
VWKQCGPGVLAPLALSHPGDAMTSDEIRAWLTWLKLLSDAELQAAVTIANRILDDRRRTGRPALRVIEIAERLARIRRRKAHRDPSPRPPTLDDG